MAASIKQNISKHISLSEKKADEFCELFEPRFVKKKEFLLKAGEVCRFEGFVTKGLFRVYHIDKDGVDQVLYFAAEDWRVADIDSFTNDRPSWLYIEALEDAEVLLSYCYH